MYSLPLGRGGESKCRTKEKSVSSQERGEKRAFNWGKEKRVAPISLNKKKIVSEKKREVRPALPDLREGFGRKRKKRYFQKMSTVYFKKEFLVKKKANHLKERKYLSWTERKKSRKKKEATVPGEMASGGFLPEGGGWGGKILGKRGLGNVGKGAEKVKKRAAHFFY